MILVEEKLGLLLNVKTYGKGSSKLFDYSSKEFKEINAFIDNGTYLVRKGEKIIRVDNQSSIEYRKGEELLFYIRKMKNGMYSLENPLFIKNILLTEENINNLNNKIWYVLNSNNPNYTNPNADYFLCKFDIIKMGNVKLMVRDIHIKENEEIKQNIENKITDYDINSLNKENTSIFDLSPEPKKYCITAEEAINNNKKCKFCYKYECSIEDPIICFCKCDNFFHFNCFKNIIRKKVSISQNKEKSASNYYIKDFCCKECKLNFPLKFKIKEKEQFFEFIKIELPKENNYIILESIENKIYYGHIKLISVIKLNEKEIINIGRERVNDIIIPDPSISREHAEIKFEKGNIFIKNKSKKFGTLILIKKSLKINENKICLQIGRTMIEASRIRFGEFEKLKLKNKIEHLTKKD